MQLSFYMNRRHTTGFTLVELMTVLAVICLLSFWLIKATKETYRDYRIRAVIDQARQNLSLLELVRRSNMVPGVDGYEWSELVAYLEAQDADSLAVFVDKMKSVEFDERVTVENPEYSFNEKNSSVLLTFRYTDVAGVLLPSAEKLEDEGGNITTFRLFSRDSDPMVFSYVADSVYMKQRLGL